MNMGPGGQGVLGEMELITVCVKGSTHLDITNELKSMFEKIDTTLSTVYTTSYVEHAPKISTKSPGIGPTVKKRLICVFLF